ncbi:MAG TPA: DUF2335 domain-containing protein [Solirubrobacteraceae bacterium]|nr:DUF2335 domain-containing protein [Solirubrobacteraceae bacterium]
MADPRQGLTSGEQGPLVDQAEVVDGEAEEQDSTDERLVRLLAQRSFSGPLPPPEMLARYNDALPDGADRIVKMAEDQSAHRRTIESRGQIFGFTLALVAIVGGIALIADGKSAEGLVPLVSALAGLVGLFIYGEVRGRATRPKEPPDEPPAVTTA